MYLLEWSSRKFYYGYTGRPLAERVEEHQRGGNAKVMRAFREEGYPNAVEILKHEHESTAAAHERELIESSRSDPKCLNSA